MTTVVIYAVHNEKVYIIVVMWLSLQVVKNKHFTGGCFCTFGTGWNPGFLSHFGYFLGGFCTPLSHFGRYMGKISRFCFYGEFA
jgi:hypothetical protein